MSRTIKLSSGEITVEVTGNILMFNTRDRVWLNSLMEMCDSFDAVAADTPAAPAATDK
jgi:hypothetical protein